MIILKTPINTCFDVKFISLSNYKLISLVVVPMNTISDRKRDFLVSTYFVILDYAYKQMQLGYI